MSNSAALAVSFVVGFFLTPAMLHYLGEKRFGIWTLVSSLVGYYGLLDFGVGSAVFRYVPLFHGQGNHHRVSAVVSTSLGFYNALGLVILVITLAFAHPLARFFDGGPELAGLLRIIGLATALNMPTIVLNTTTASYESFVPANFVAASTQLFRGALLIVCIWSGYGLVTMGCAVVVANLASLLGNSIVFRRVCHDVQLSFKLITWTELRMLLTFGSVILLVGTANSLATESPKQIVAKTISLDALGLFGIPLLLISYYRTLIISLTKVFSPRFSYLAGRQEKDEIRRLFTQGCRYMTIIAGALAVLLWVIGPDFLLLWTKKPAVAATAPYLIIMVGGTLVFLSHRLGSDLLFGLGRLKQVAFLELVEAAGIVVLTILLSFKFGMKGAAWGITLPPIIVRGLIQTVFVCRAIELSFARYYSTCILRTWLVVIALCGLAKVVHYTSTIIGWVSLFALSGLLVLTYGMLVYLLVLDRPERLSIREQGARALGRLRMNSAN